MGEVSKYPNGTFCWVDLGTTDVAGAKRFYGELFGWDSEDVPAGGHTYTVFRLRGHDVAGMHQHPAGDDSGWDSAVAVDDVDAATERARELGATVLHEPGEVPGVARSARIADPGGAVLGLSERRGHLGAGLVNEVGAWNWNELVSPAVDAAGEFYAALFGWTATANPGPIPRASFSLGELLVGGGHAPTPQEGEAARWTVSFMVADADRSVALAQRLGGALLFGPLEVPVGKFAIVADPAGASFTVTASTAAAFRGVDGS
jgi:predicted enzyme related to lactoylglutathione lyase